MKQLFLIDKVKDNPIGFELRVRSIAQDVEINPDWLMAVMFFESRLNPKAVNKYTGATGLIQFMPNTAKDLGTSVYDLSLMSNIQQLDFVRNYFMRFKGKLRNLGDTYLAVFYPSLIGKSGNTELPKKVQDQNPVFKSYWVNGKLVKDSIVNYFLNFYKSIPVSISLVSISILLLFTLIFFNL